jgi:hypothetical protein
MASRQKYINVQAPKAAMNKRRHLRCHYKRNSGSAPAGTNNLHIGEPAGRQTPFDSNASSVEAQAHTSCNRRAGYYVRETAPPLAPVPRHLDCGTGAATRGNPAHGPTVPTEHIGHGSVSRGEGATVDMAKSGPAVMATAGGRKQRSHRLQAYVPSWDSDRALSHGVKTTCPCSVPRTARARTTAAPRTTRLVALTLRQDRQHLWQAKQATLHLCHNDRIKKGAPHRSILYRFSSSSFSLLLQGPRKGILRKGSFSAKEAGPEPPTDQRFEGWPLGRVRQPPQSTRAPSPPTDQRFEGWPLGRVLKVA